MGFMNLFNPKIPCVICDKESGWTSNNTPIGRVCPDCMQQLANKSITLLNIKKHNIEELKTICGVNNTMQDEITKDISAYEKLGKKIIENVPLSLKKEEVCFYMNDAKAFHSKNVVTGTKSGGAGASLRIAKGVSIRTGGGESKVVRGNVNEYFDGTLYITNMRIILLAPKYGFDVMIPKITQLSYRNDGFFIYVGSKCYSVITHDVKNIKNLIDLINEASQEQETKSTTENKQNDSFAELREYKKLLDEGIITIDEFEAKKKQLLNL